MMSLKRHEVELAPLLLICSSLLVLLLSTGCAKKKQDISTVGSGEVITKSDITGCAAGQESGGCLKTYSAAKVLMQANEELSEGWLIPGFHADLGYVQFIVTESELQVKRIGEANRPDDKATIVASYPITSHFDIIREKNDFQEDTNKIVEDTKKPWNQRQYMRVDWGTNKVSTTSLANIFGTFIEEDGSKVVSPLKKEGNLLSFDVDTTVKMTADGGYWGENSSSGALRAHVKNAFLEIKKSDYKPLEMSNKDFSRFGYFRTYENIINPDRGATVSGMKKYANKFNVCEASGSGSCATNKITYVLNRGFPDEFKPAARDVVAAWNKSFKKALDRDDDVVVLDESIDAEIGDLRYSMITAVDDKVPTGLLGVSQTTNNPNTGETLSARASIYLGAVRVQAGNAVELFDILMGAPPPGSPASLGLPTAGSSSGLVDVQATLKLDPAENFAAQLNYKRRLLGLQKYKFDKGMSQLTSSTISKVKSKVTESKERALARREKALDNVPSLFHVPDVAWANEVEAVGVAKMNQNLKNNFSMASQGKSVKLKFLKEAAEGIHGSDFIEPAVELFVRKFIAEHQGEPVADVREKLKLEIRQMVFNTTLVHEMGHNFGLRHNFAGSADKEHYSQKYVDLQKKKDALAAANPNDPQITLISLEQESYDFSSVMDYAGGFHEALGGTGPYDDAAIRFGYNGSINKNTDSVVAQNYAFCTDHQVGEDLLCARWDKGSNVGQATTRLIDEYQRGYVFRNFRRDRLNFGSPSAQIGRVISRFMLPLRQVVDEFLFQIITSPRSAGSLPTDCGLVWLRDSVKAGEVANICDPAVVQKYVELGIDPSDWSQFVYFLLKEDGSGLRKSPDTYVKNGFADLLYANYLVSEYFTSVIGAPEPGLYLPLSNGVGNVLEKLPSGGSDVQRLAAFLLEKGLTIEQIQTLLPKLLPNLVDLNPGRVGKYLLSLAEVDGSFRQIDTVGFVYDKIAATLVMGVRGLPVEKYDAISLYTNMYFSPQSKSQTNGLMNALITNKTEISTEVVTTRGGKRVTAGVPASLDRINKIYGLIVASSDFISDQDQEMSDKLRICVEGDHACDNPFGLKAVSFRGANSQAQFKAVQVLTGDSIAFDMVEKGDALSKARDKAVADIKNADQLKSDIAKALEGSAPEAKPEKRGEAFTKLVNEKAGKIAKKISKLLAKNGTGVQDLTLWQKIIKNAKDLDNAKVSDVLQTQEELPLAVEEVSAVIEKELADQPEVQKLISEKLNEVVEDLTKLDNLTVRVVASPQVFQQATDELPAIEVEAKLIRSVLSSLGVE